MTTVTETEPETKTEKENAMSATQPTTTPATETKPEAEAKKAPAKKGGKLAAAIKKAAPKAKPDETEAEGGEEGTEPEGKGLKATASWKELVGSLVPSTKEEAAVLTDDAIEAAKQNDANRVRLGRIVLALRERVRSTSDTSREQKAKRALSSHNGFSLTPFKTEDEWAVAVGLATKKIDSEGKAGYLRNRLQQAVNQALFDLSLIEAGQESGASSVSSATVTLVGRSSKSFVKKIVPEIVKLQLKGTSTDDIQKKLERMVKDEATKREEEHVEFDAKEADTETLYTQLKKKIDGARNLIGKQGMLKDRCAAAKRYTSILFKKKDLTEAQRSEIQTQLNKLATDCSACLTALGAGVKQE